MLLWLRQILYWYWKQSGGFSKTFYFLNSYFWNTLHNVYSVPILTKFYVDWTDKMNDQNLLSLFNFNEEITDQSISQSWNPKASSVLPHAPPSVKNANILPPETIAVGSDQTLVPSWTLALRVICKGTVSDLFKTNKR